MGRIVIACYRPKPGKESELAPLVKTHLARLAAEGLVTDRKRIVMQAEDGTFVEVFEWVSEEAIERAHHNPRVLEMWSEYEQVCDYVPISSVAEATQLFSGFRPVDFDD